MQYKRARTVNPTSPSCPKNKKMQQVVLMFLIISHINMSDFFSHPTLLALLQMLISYPCGHLCYFMSSCDAIRNIRTTCCVFFLFGHDGDVGLTVLAR